MDLRAEKRRSVLSQPYGASSVSLQRSLTQRSSLEADASRAPARAQSLRSIASPRARPDVVVKAVCVGDGGCGKTSLLTRYVRGGFPNAYVPTVFENDTKAVQAFGLAIELSLWDTAGQEDYDRLRALSYPETSVFIVCFSIDSPISLLNAKEKWLPEIRFYCPHVPFVLVGLKADLRRTLGAGLVAADTARDAARDWGAVAYVESSARLNVNVERVFDECIAAVLRPLRKPTAAKTAPEAKPAQAAKPVQAAKPSDSRAGRAGLLPRARRMFSDTEPPPTSKPRCIVS